MLSILIPVFNFDVRRLVADLSEQCRACHIEWEIICFDDGSTENYRHLNRTAEPRFGSGERQTGVWRYEEMPENLGRSAIRNALGKAARFPYLLFMDCDSKVVREDLIQKYLDHLAPDALVYGGRCYSSIPPADPKLFFHWHYGTRREQSTAQQRRRAPYDSFMTNNFLIPKDIFLSILFDETLKQYGHEDTLFGMELKKRQVRIVHIDNPLEHIGLEPVEVFLEKTKMGLENLLALWKRGATIATSLLSAYKQCRRWRLDKLLSLLFPVFEPLFERQLKSGKPLLFLFDLYKLGWMARKGVNGIQP